MKKQRKPTLEYTPVFPTKEPNERRGGENENVPDLLTRSNYQLILEALIPIIERLELMRDRYYFGTTDYLAVQEELDFWNECFIYNKNRLEEASK